MILLRTSVSFYNLSLERESSRKSIGGLLKTMTGSDDVDVDLAVKKFYTRIEDFAGYVECALKPSEVQWLNDLYDDTLVLND